METKVNGTIKTIITGLVTLVLVFVLVKVVLWNLYNTNIFDYLNNDAEKINFTYNDVTREYVGLIDQKYNVTLKDPIKYNFNGYLEVSEKQSLVWKENGNSTQEVLTFRVNPDFKSNFAYTVVVESITSQTSFKLSEGSFDIDIDTLKLIEDNTDSQNAAQYLSAYKDRIQKLVDVAKTAFGEDIR